MLIDRFNRVINYVRISVTDRCNLRCRYCVDGEFPFVPHDEILSYEEIIRFVKIVEHLGITKVRLTGGEPLIRKGIAYLLGRINDMEGIRDVSLTTNGVFLARCIQDLRDAGLRRINISLDSLKKERFNYITQVDALDLVLNGIEMAMYAGLHPIKINTVIIKGFNDDEIFDFARLAAKWDIHVRFIEFMPFGESGLWDMSRIMPSNEIEKMIREKYELEAAPNAEKGPAKMFHMKDGLGKIGFISPVSTHICNECNRIRLTSNGAIRPCLFSDVEYDVKKLLREGADDDTIGRFIMTVIDAKPHRKPEGAPIKKCQRNLRSVGG